MRKKRKLNIEQMKIEYQQTLKQREAAARSLKPNEVKYSDFKLPTSTFLKFGTYTTQAGNAITEINEALKKSSDNTGKYNKTLETLRQRYSEIISLPMHQKILYEYCPKFLSRHTKTHQFLVAPHKYRCFFCSPE